MISQTMFWILTGGASVLLGLLLWYFTRHQRQSVGKGYRPTHHIENGSINPYPPTPPPVVNIDLQPLHKALEELPNKVLQSIQNSTNTKKGALGELIGYIELKAEYDRIIPLGNIVDFVCIKLPKSSEPGRIDFVDVKTGKNSRLSKDQRGLQKLIKNKQINFVTIKIDES